MDLRKLMLQEFQEEAGLTRSVFQCIPDSLLDYQASESLHSIRWNTSHLAEIPGWADYILRQDQLDVAPEGQPPYRTKELATMEEAREVFDRNVATAVKVLEEFSLDSLEDPWSLLAGGEVLFTQPRYTVYRKFLITHVAHHRGHLLAYLRIKGVETPSLYG